MGDRLREEAHKLAMLVLQSDFYAEPEVKETVDNILALHGEAKQQPDYDGKYPKDFNKPDEWEAWVQRMPNPSQFRIGDDIAWNVVHEKWQQWFREMPRKEQP